ncbi:MAG: Xaa-Pro peptidase family protein [Pseudomonadota bacterium]
MRDFIVDRLQQHMAATAMDGIVCLSPENFAYVSGFVVPSQPLMRWRHAAVVVPAQGAPAYLTVDMEESTVAAKANGSLVRSWGEFTDSAMEVLANLLSELGLGTATLGIEMDYLPAGDYQTLSSKLPGAVLCPVQDELARLREVKTGEEIELLRRLARLADASIADALADVRPGSTEMDIAAGLTRNIYARGADDFKLMIVATGERSVFPNVGPTMRKLRPGDICRVEIFAVVDGYHAGVCRTARVGHSPPHADAIWKNLVESKYEVLEMIKPGASTREIYETFLRRLSRLDLPPISFVGHGIGLHLHEEPYLGKYSDEPLQSGMVLGIEPLVYDTGYGFGMQNKDIVLVTDTGSELLSDVTDTDSLLTVS